MKITPIDIQQMEFKTRVRGYDRREVDAFLDAVSENYETIVRENRGLRDRMADLELQLSELKKKEATLNNTLVKAQGLVEQMHQNAHKEAELITKEAEMRAEQMMKTALTKISDTRNEILDLEKEKIVFVEKVQSLVRTFQKTIEAMEKQDRGLDHRRRSGHAPAEERQDDNLRVVRQKP